MTDTLSEFLLNLSPADVEGERQAPLASARLESFGLPAHKFMLAIHDVRVARLARGATDRWRSDSDELHGAARLRAARAESEHWNQRHPRIRPTPRPDRIKRVMKPRFTDTQLAVALAALNGKKN